MDYVQDNSVPIKDHPELTESVAYIETEVRTEIEDFLEKDQSRLGGVYRGLKRHPLVDGESHTSRWQAIADDLGVGADNSIPANRGTFVWNNERIIDMLLDRTIHVTKSGLPSATETRNRYRSLLSQWDWTPGTRKRLTEDLENLEKAVAKRSAAQSKIKSDAIEVTEKVEARDITGIYAWAYPQYLRYPDPEADGRVLVKVGQSKKAIARIDGTARVTGMPEDPIYLRVYPTEDRNLRSVEGQIQKTLRDFGHGAPRGNTTGTEWFLTTVGHLDQLAEMMGLPESVVDIDPDDFLV